METTMDLTSENLTSTNTTPGDIVVAALLGAAFAAATFYGGKAIKNVYVSVRNHRKLKARVEAIATPPDQQ